jgi:hypothetical protein
MSDLKKIQEAFPNAKDNDLIVALVEALDDAKDKLVMAKSPSGVALSKELWAKCLDLILRIRTSYIKVSEHELRAMCAALDVQMSLYEELCEAGVLVDIAQSELDEALQEL